MFAPGRQRRKRKLALQNSFYIREPQAYWRGMILRRLDGDTSSGICLRRSVTRVMPFREEAREVCRERAVHWVNWGLQIRKRLRLPECRWPENVAARSSGNSRKRTATFERHFSARVCSILTIDGPVCSRINRAGDEWRAHDIKQNG